MNAILINQRKNSRVLEFSIEKASKEQLAEINNELALGFSAEELRVIQSYFINEKRNPTDVELQTISQTWSEHCCHKTFKGKIELEGKEIQSLFKSYIAKATKQIKAPWCVSVFEDNEYRKFDKGYGIA
jgi:phosphoribosylformylglycinamidine synthase